MEKEKTPKNQNDTKNATDSELENQEPSQGFWANAWHRYRKDRVSMLGFYVLMLMFFVAFFAPVIVGTKPIICKYQGEYYFPCLGYIDEDWESPIFRARDRFGGLYPGNLQKQPQYLLEKAKNKQNRYLKKLERINKKIAKIESKRPKLKKSTLFLQELLLEYPQDSDTKFTFAPKPQSNEIFQNLKEFERIEEKLEEYLEKWRVKNENWTEYFKGFIFENQAERYELLLRQKLFRQFGQRKLQQKSEVFLATLDDKAKESALRLLREQELRLIAEKLETPSEKSNFKRLLNKESKEYVELIWEREKLKKQNELLDAVKDEIRARQKEPHDSSKNWAIYPLIFADPYDKIKVDKIQKMVKEGYIKKDSWIASFQEIEPNTQPPLPLPLGIYNAWLKWKMGIDDFKYHLDKKIKQIEKEIKELEKQEKVSKDLLKEKKSFLETLQKKSETLKGQIQEFDTKIEELKKELLPLTQEADKFQKEMKGLQNQIDKHYREINKLKDEIKKLEEEESATAIENIKTLNQQLAEKIKEKDAKVPDLRKQIKSVQEKVQQLAPDLKKLRKQLEALEEKKDILEGKNSRTQEKRLQNFFGTDQYGRDVFARVIHGTRIALLIGFVSMGISAFIGIILGGIAGFFGGFIDTIISRFIDLVMSIPSLILILAMIAIVEEPDIWHVMIVIGLTSWVSIARLTRGEFLKLKSLDYVTAGQALGFSNTRIMFRHILPNALAPVVVNITFGIASAILTETGLSFLGFGVQEPTPSWGNILSSGGLTDWWLIGSASVAIFIAIVTYNVVGDGLQEALDPRLK